MKVLMLTGPKGAGKTTLLLEWLQDNEAGGILSPVEDGKRAFVSISSGLAWPMEAGPEEKGTVNVGRYAFSQAAFDQAVATLLFDLRAGNYPIIIDEVGPLELRGEGLHKVLMKITGSDKVPSLILVVREGLTEEVKKAYFEGADGVDVASIEKFKEKARSLKRAFQ
ncbi:nucleoside-triphosphatase [Roseivirga sp. BDSF3-8]|uniref:nucleoside-triphosphatase n=1 Tax=Roseivirga sp. BDSF3-8 TaxID=3241598 RepID=UPI0035319E59